MKKYYNIHTLWIAMLVLTLTTYAMGKLGYGGITIVLFLLATVLLKGVFIIREFMELRGVSFLWRAIMYGWLWLVTIVIGITYIISS
ncbi:MAG: cytochrome C oxidase subunit IV family protein [Cocleimonas sp.]|nr:cytochrome C oxidase subunit IV family protein [Cocleimonas sp.]